MLKDLLRSIRTEDYSVYVAWLEDRAHTEYTGDTAPAAASNGSGSHYSGFRHCTVRHCTEYPYGVLRTVNGVIVDKW